jgi:hypothetical protein
MTIVKEKNMAPMYVHICASVGLAQDEALLKQMTDANEKEKLELEAKVEDAKKNHGDIEVRLLCVCADVYADVYVLMCVLMCACIMRVLMCVCTALCYVCCATFRCAVCAVPPHILLLLSFFNRLRCCCLL